MCSCCLVSECLATELVHSLASTHVYHTFYAFFPPVTFPSPMVCWEESQSCSINFPSSPSPSLHHHYAHTEENSVTFSYSVHWQESEVAWASRWDIYLHMSDVQIHWFAICNSVAIVLFLSGMPHDQWAQYTCDFAFTFRDLGSYHCAHFAERHCSVQQGWGAG